MESDLVETRDLATGGSRGGWHRRPALITAVLLAVIVTLLVTTRSENTDDAAVRAECPADLGDCSGVDTTLPSVATTAPPNVTTTSVAVGELLTAQTGTLRLEVRIDPTALVTAQTLRINVRAVDKAGAAIVGGHDFGDGFGGGAPRAPILECLTSPTTTAPIPDEEETWTFDYSYRRPGRYTLLVEVVSTSCWPEDRGDRVDLNGNDELDEGEGEPERRAIVTTTLNVAPGALLSNGPLLPVVALDRVPSRDEPDKVMLNVGGRDVDGWMQKLVLDWGDGSQPFVVERAASNCVDPLKRWPGPSEILELPSHRYPTSGAYTATLTVTSTACDGSGAQAVTQTISVDAP